MHSQLGFLAARCRQGRCRRQGVKSLGFHSNSTQTTMRKSDVLSDMRTSWGFKNSTAKKVDQRKFGRPPLQRRRRRRRGAEWRSYPQTLIILSRWTVQQQRTRRLQWAMSTMRRSLQPFVSVSPLQKKKKISLSNYFPNRHLKRSWQIIGQVSVTRGPNIHQQASRRRLSVRHKYFRGDSACAFRGCSGYKRT